MPALGDIAGTPSRDSERDEALVAIVRDPLLRFAQSSFRIVPRPRFLVNSELLLLPNRSR